MLYVHDYYQGKPSVLLGGSWSTLYLQYLKSHGCQVFLWRTKVEKSEKSKQWLKYDPRRLYTLGLWRLRVWKTLWQGCCCCCCCCCGGSPNCFPKSLDDFWKLPQQKSYYYVWEPNTYSKTAISSISRYIYKKNWDYKWVNASSKTKSLWECECVLKSWQQLCTVVFSLFGLPHFLVPSQECRPEHQQSPHEIKRANRPAAFSVVRFEQRPTSTCRWVLLY